MKKFLAALKEWFVDPEPIIGKEYYIPNENPFHVKIMWTVVDIKKDYLLMRTDTGLEYSMPVFMFKRVYELNKGEKE